ncbi:MAG: alcohol dehydrogenase [Moraxellaceae bacterium]|nr:MAG: alcohol dehydrogenase [Moraxellaceae bacterium]
MIKAYAAVEPGGPLEPFEYDPGPLEDEEVEITVEHCGICHSDLSMLNNEWGMTQYPFVPGHEVIGIVAAVGTKVTTAVPAGGKALSVGERVGLGWHSDYCNQCDSCHSGDHNLCGEAKGTIVGRHGGFADKVRAHMSSVVRLPVGLDAQRSGPLFCGGITVFNPLVQFDIKPTAKVAVIGIGGLGHMALKILNAWGCEVTAFTSSESKREEALKFGAYHTVSSTDPEQLAEVVGRFDLILSTVNVALDWQAYITTLKPKGRLHFLGAVMEPISLSVFSLLSNQISVSASPVGSPVTIAKMLDFCVRHDIQPTIESFSFEQVNEAMARVVSGDARYRVVLSHN